MKCEWHDEKAAVNVERHGVSFELASSIFSDPHVVTMLDEAHSIGEYRFISLGEAATGDVLFVAHTEREEGSEIIIRLISARYAESYEEEIYEQQKFDYYEN